jgi:hypothetical protein
VAVARPRARVKVAAESAAPAAPGPWVRRIAIAVGGVAVVAVGLLWLSPGFPERWLIDVTGWFDAFRDWAIENRATHWLFTGFLTPIEDTISAVFDQTVAVLERLTWIGLIVTAAGIAGARDRHPARDLGRAATVGRTRATADPRRDADDPRVLVPAPVRAAVRDR